MAVKKAKAKKMMKKKAPAKKRAARSMPKVGDTYVCNVCGLAVTVDEACDCVDPCDIICCETPMKKKR
jgi:rubrerythrin